MHGPYSGCQRRLYMLSVRPCRAASFLYFAWAISETVLTDESRHKLQSTENFIDAIKTVQVPDDYKLVSFDVKSLFTSIPLQLALDCTETAINNSTIELPLPTDDLMDLLNLCLTSTYFQYNMQALLITFPHS